MPNRVHNRVTGRQGRRLHRRSDALEVLVSGDVQLVGVLGHLGAGAVITPLIGRRALSHSGVPRHVLVLA